jgi:hypothetical protein
MRLSIRLRAFLKVEYGNGIHGLLSSTTRGAAQRWGSIGSVPIAGAA